PVEEPWVSGVPQVDHNVHASHRLGGHIAHPSHESTPPAGVGLNKAELNRLPADKGTQTRILLAKSCLDLGERHCAEDAVATDVHHVARKDFRVVSYGAMGAYGDPGGNQNAHLLYVQLVVPTMIVDRWVRVLREDLRDSLCARWITDP